MYKTYCVEFQISNEISSTNYNAFAITFSPNASNVSAAELPVDRVQAYFNAKILVPPYKFPSVISFFSMISTHEIKMLKDFIQLLDYEMVCLLYLCRFHFYSQTYSKNFT